MRRSREHRRRIQAFLALVLFLGGGLWSFHHEAVVEHAICPEHGELVDVAAAGEGEHREDGPGFVPASDGEAVEHGHCPIVALLRERSVQHELEPALLTLASVSAPLAPRPAGTSWESFARFLLAPNHSPPRAA